MSRNSRVDEGQAIAQEDSRGDFESYFVHAPVALFIFDAGGIVLEVNQAGATLLKTERPQILGKPFTAFLAREYHATFSDHLHRTVETGLLQTGELRIGSPDTHQVWTRLESRRRPGSPARVQCISTMMDITDRKRVEDDLILARDGALAANRTKNEFLASVSHEIRTPMSGIIAMSELVMGTNLTGEQRRYLGAVQSSAGSLLSVVDDLLDVSRIEADHVSLAREPFRLRDLASTVIALFEPSAAQKGISLRTDMPGTESSVVRGDRNRIRQVLINLVSNAIRYTETGSVTLRVREEELSGFLKEITFEVADTGPGIEPEEQKRIHALFRRPQEGETQRYSEQQLGLAISRKLARLMGGQLYFETAPGRGTRFFFSIPLETSSEEDLRAAGTPGETRTGHPVAGRVLVAEDNTVNVLVLRTILEKHGYEVRTVQSGEEAIVALEQESFDLVLMDISMPGMDGVTATREIRRRAAMERYQADIPVIAITAHSMKGDRERFLEAGMNDYIGKPFVQDTVIEVVRRNMPNRA